MFAQANSEHCRHKIFNAEWSRRRREASRSRCSSDQAHDRGAPARRAVGVQGQRRGRRGRDRRAVLPRRATACIAAHASRRTSSARSRPTITRRRSRRSQARRPARAARSATRARPAAAASRRPVSSASRCPTCGFPTRSSRGSATEWIGSPARIASALDIMIEGPLGGAAFNNEFGRPAILGYFRTFELASAVTARARLSQAGDARRRHRRRARRARRRKRRCPRAPRSSCSAARHS